MELQELVYSGPHGEGESNQHRMQYFAGSLLMDRSGQEYIQVLLLLGLK